MQTRLIAPFVPALLVSILIGSMPGDAVEILVSTNADSGNGSLRQALQFNASLGGGNTILFSNRVISPIVLGSELPITASATLVGPGPDLLTISGNNVTRIFRITTNLSVSLSGLTIAHGSGAGSGGGILMSNGTVTLRSCIIGTNSSFQAGEGGGIALFGGALTLVDCALVGNQATGGGGGIYRRGGSLSLVNCTIAGNRTQPGNGGGGIYTLAQDTAMTLTHCTIYGNSTASRGGGIWILENFPPTVRNTIIAGNTASDAGSDCSGIFISEGYNFIGKTNNSTGWGVLGDQLGNDLSPLDPRLSPLGMNGGSTPTMYPLTGSPVIDQGKGFGISVDQRGRPRPYTNDFVPTIPFGGDRSDIGAVETGEQLTLLVTKTNDAGPGSLRRAILEASRTGDTIAFAPQVTNTITLTGGELVVDKELIIVGPGANVLRLSGNNSSRVFNFSGGSVTLSGLTIANGSATVGGGIRLEGGSHAIFFCQIASNAAGSLFGFGGGGLLLENDAMLSVYNSSIVHNQAGYTGGGIYHRSSNSLSLYNCTIASNRVTAAPQIGFPPHGGGLTLNYGTLNLYHCTLASNTATRLSGGIDNSFNPRGVANIFNSIVAGNNATEWPDVGGSFTSGGYNFIGATNGSTSFTNGVKHDQAGAIGFLLNPLLGPLADYGGATPTMALRPGSPAIDQGTNFQVGVDQRLSPRPLNDLDVPNASGGDGSDIGAFEVDPNLRIVELRRVGGDVALSLMTVLGRNYLVEYTHALPYTNDVPWTPLTNGAPGNGWLLWVTNYGGANQPRRFYRTGNAVE